MTAARVIAAVLAALHATTAHPLSVLSSNHAAAVAAARKVAGESHGTVAATVARGVQGLLVRLLLIVPLLQCL